MIGLCLLVLCGLRCHQGSYYPGSVEARYALVTAATTTATPVRDSYTEPARSDPLAFLKMCRRHYLAQVSDYRCHFIIQERINGALSAEQHIDVLYRENPYSVDMRWVKNPGPASRVNYVAGRWVENDRELALIKPSGLLGLLAPRGVKRDIHAPGIRVASRRPIDQFGFRNTLDLMIRYCELARGAPAYHLRYIGGGTLDGRPCYVIERRLPYCGEDGPYPDRLLVVYIDSKWLVPTGCFAYADDAKQDLLGSYVLTDVEFNVGLTDEDF